MITLAAIGLAVLAAACFALAAAWQHRAAGAAFVGSPEPAATRRLTPRRLLRTVRNRWWLIGLGLAGVGAVLHAVGLALAPVSVIQPVGVLAVPFAVLISSRLAGTRPSRAVVVAVLLCMAGVIAFVALAAGAADTARLTEGRMISAALVLGGIVITFALIGARGPHWLRSAGWASAGAVLYGFVSVLMRATFLMLRDGVPLSHSLVIGAVIGMIISFAGGLWLIQQALASGRPEVVVGAQTVLDPTVAVLAGVVLLGEGAHLTASTTAGLVVAGLLAMAGVLRLARHQALHPGGAEPHTNRRTDFDRVDFDRTHFDRTHLDTDRFEIDRLAPSSVGVVTGNNTHHPGEEARR